MARICIVTPAQIGSNPRVVREADALAAAGFDVRVVAARRLAVVEARDQDIIARKAWRLDRIDFTVSELSKGRRLRQIAAQHAYALLGSPTLAETASSVATSALVRAAAAAPADLYIAHQVAALPAAARAAQRHGARYAFDAEDFHLGELPDEPRHRLEKRIIHAIESRYLPAAAYVTAAAPLIADAYAETYGAPRPAIVLNTFPRANGPAQWSPKGAASPGPTLYWFSQTIGPGRGLETAIEAIARASSAPHLHLRGTPSPGYERHLRALAAHHRVAERLHLLAPAPPSEMERLGSQFDLGYAGEPGFSANNSLALSNKLFSYLCSGIPVLASDVPSHKAIAPEMGEAMTLFQAGDAAALAAALDRILLEPARLSAMRERAWRLGQERYCWEVEQRALIDVVGAAVGIAAPAKLDALLSPAQS